MTEDTDAVAPPGSGDNGPTPAEEHPEAPSPETSEQEASGEGTEGETEAPAEEVELDIWGEKYKLPKGSVPDEILSKLDEIAKGSQRKYTTETQRLADERRALEAEKTVVQTLATLKQEGLTAYSEGLRLRQEIEQLQSVDVASLWQSNPDQARQISDMLARKQAEFQRTVQKVSEYEAKATAEEQQHVARLAEEGRQKVLKSVKGFDEARVIEYASKTYGIPEAEAKKWPLNPAGAVMAWKAMMYDQLQAKAVPAAKPPAPPAAPVTAVKARTAPQPKSVYDDNISDAEWFALRQRQLAKAKG